MQLITSFRRLWSRGRCRGVATVMERGAALFRYAHRFNTTVLDKGAALLLLNRPVTAIGKSIVFHLDL